MKCAKCKSDRIVKSGFINNRQRFLCKSCSYKFLEPNMAKIAMMKQAVYLYSSGLSFRTIAKYLGVSPSTILRWVKRFAETSYSKPRPSEPIEVELDEIWHFVDSKKTNSGFGNATAEQPNNF